MQSKKNLKRNGYQQFIENKPSSYSGNDNYNLGKKKKKKGRGKMIAIISLCVLFVLVGSAAVVAHSLGFDITPSNPLASSKYKRFETKAGLNSSLLGAGSFDNQNEINILIFGIDRSEARDDVYEIYRPDTIMVANINFQTKSIKLISIPRDSRVDIHNTGGRDKINASFMYAYNHLSTSEREEEGRAFEEGAMYLQETASALLGGIPIDYYLGVDMEALPLLGDAVGGVEIYVHQDIYVKYEEPLSEGLQVLSGEQLLTYSRCRDYAEGDIERVRVQQTIMMAIFDQFKKTGSFMDVPKIYNMAKDMIITNLNFAQIASLGYNFSDFSSEDLTTYTMPGMFGNLNSVSYWIINQSARVTFIKEHFGIDATILTQDPQRDSSPEAPEEETFQDDVITQPETEPDPTPDPEPEPDPDPNPDPDPDPEPEPETTP